MVLLGVLGCPKRKTIHTASRGQRATFCSLPDPTEGSLSTHRKAVGGSIPLEVGSYSPQQEKGSHGADTGLSGESLSLSGKVLFWAALRLPYLLGTLCHHEEAGLPDGEQQHRAAGYLPPDPTEGSLSEKNIRLLSQATV